MNYLGQQIDLIEQSCGWIGIWQHPLGYIEVGFFPTASTAWEAVADLIRHSFAVQSLVELVGDWLEAGLISESEYAANIAALVESVMV
jgi:hypothetical protein